MPGVIVNNTARSWKGRRDEEGHRYYWITHRIQMANTLEGPAWAIQTPGLPIPGYPWVIDADLDLYAWCRADAEITPVAPEGEPNLFFDVTQLFSTKPPGSGAARGGQRCQDNRIESPLLEPPRISGAFTKYTEEATHDRFRRPIKTSSHEQIRGALNEWDSNRATIRIEMNVATYIQLQRILAAIDKVNSVPIWGFNRRCVKLSAAPWEQRYYGLCYVYYNVVMEFETNVRTFDRVFKDEGTKALRGHWVEQATQAVPVPGQPRGELTWQLETIFGDPPDPNNPAHFNLYLDPNGNRTVVTLDGRGVPWQPTNAGNQVSGVWEEDVGLPGNGGPGDTCVNAYILDTEGVTYSGQDTAPNTGRSVFLISKFRWGFPLPSNQENHTFWFKKTGVGRRSFTVMLLTDFDSVEATTAGGGAITSGGTVRITAYKNTCGNLIQVDQQTISDAGAPVATCVGGDFDVGDAFLEVTVDHNTISGKGFAQFVVNYNETLCANRPNNPGGIRVEKYDETNFFLLGVPAVL